MHLSKNKGFQKNEKLEELITKVERELEKEDLEENSCIGNRRRYYFLEIKLHELLVKRTQEEVNYYSKKLDFSLRNIFEYSISRIKRYKKIMNEAQRRFEEYSNALKQYKEEYENSFTT